MAIQDLIGKEFPFFDMPVEWGKIREFAMAIGDDNPIYSDPAYAAKTEFGDILAPPTFTATKAFWRKGESLSELAGLDPYFRLHGEEEYEYFRPILAGDVLTCKSKIAEAYERVGKRGGKMTFIVLEFAFYNQKVEKVLISRTTTIHTEGAVKN
ncbi:MAG: MaoC family dehydratase N-terminal domain-containing protein [Thermodesulfobacteriota bacterium]|nr:MaoC family dehydratase N-terminal domain-containing protein [Thermodesulfobacteriota bacterium]